MIAVVTADRVFHKGPTLIIIKPFACCNIVEFNDSTNCTLLNVILY